jgi:Domain of unknown function (DUF4123)
MDFFIELIEKEAKANSGGPGGVTVPREHNIYVVVDCARHDTLGVELDARFENVKSLAQSERNGPMLAQASIGDPAMRWLQENGGRNRWFITIVTTADFASVWRHARQLTAAKLYTGEVISFRFYDPFTIVTQLKAFSFEQRLFFFSVFQTCFAQIDETLMQFQCDQNGVIAWSRHIAAGTAPEPHNGLESLPVFDVSGSAVRPMFAFNKAQYEKPILSNIVLLVDDLDQYLRPDFDARMNLYPPGILRAMLEMGAQTAFKDYGINDLEGIRQFVDLQWSVAPGFHREPNIHKLLKNSSLSTEERFERLSSPDYTDPIANAFAYDEVKEWRLPLPSNEVPA